MVYLCLDTCVWLELLRAPFDSEDTIFDEILYWIEGGHITCITTQNLIDEWNRQKGKKRLEISKDQQNEDKRSWQRANPSRPFTDQSGIYEDILSKRITRIEAVLETRALKASVDNDILIDAGNRNLIELAPNRVKDSYRDTVNILTLINFLKQTGHKPCYFVTINYTDYSETGHPMNLHPDLQSDFSGASLQYIFYENGSQNYAGKFLHELRSHKLPSLVEYLKEKRKKEEDEKLVLRKEETKVRKTETDTEFLKNLKHIDIILSSESPTRMEQDFLNSLFANHPSYKDYFMKKLAEK